MQVILLSGGSGTRLWPLSNDARSKQFLKVLPREGSEERESMVQNVVRQLQELGEDIHITVATSASQRESVEMQLGENVDIVTEPSRRNTFPAICLACEYLRLEKGLPADEPVIVMPCDPFADKGYFRVVREMAKGVAANVAELIVMGITPTYPSAKYGYILPERQMLGEGIFKVARFIEKPDVKTAQELIAQGAQWNGGVFAFRLGYVTDKLRSYLSDGSFSDLVANYGELPKISFDYEVVERAENIGMIPFGGQWKDLGTWNTLTEELKDATNGNVITDGASTNTHIINELGIPMLCLGTQDLVIAATPDGILVSEKRLCENIKHYAEELKKRPMFERRRWGTYRVVDNEVFADGFASLTKSLTMLPGGSISYQRHNLRDELWIITDGEGEIVVDGRRSLIARGDVISIPKGQCHALRAITSLTFIEVQTGETLIEEDIERFDFTW